MTGGRVERRLAAVLAADVAGYSRSMGEDELGTLVALKAHRSEVVDPAISRHRGRIVKTTGDGLLVEFASAVDAVTCAIAVQEKMAERNATFMPKIAFRIGINIGDIIIEGDDIFGDGVNIAARVENECEPGGVYLSGNAFEQVRGKSNLTFDDLGERSLKNIDRPVRLYAARTEISSSVNIKAASETAKALALPDRPSIAVLPFQNMSGDPEQEYFADGMVEDIITALSRFKSLFVIARNSSFTYKGKAVDIKQVGRELGVRYVLEGSVRKSGNRVRITGQLIDSTSGEHVWAERFDRELNDIFSLQDEVTQSVVGAIFPAVQSAEIERTRRKPPADLGAYDWYLRGVALYAAAQFRAALPCLRAAIEKDETYAEAHAMIAASYSSIRTAQGVPLTADELAEAVARANDAIRLGSDNALALSRAAHAVVYLGNEYDRALAIAEHARNLNPNLAAVWHTMGWISIMSSDGREAIESFTRLLRISPVDPMRHVTWQGIAWGHCFLEQYDEAYDWAAKACAVQKIPSVFASATMVVNAILSGRPDQARSAADHLKQIAPGFRIRHTREMFRTRREDLRERIAGALRLAEIPD